ERLNGSLTIGILDHFGTCECLPGTSTRLRFQIAQPPPSASAVGGRTDIKCSLLRSSFGPQSGHRCRLVEIFPKGVCPLSKPGIEPIDCHLGASSSTVLLSAPPRRLVLEWATFGKAKFSACDSARSAATYLVVLSIVAASYVGLAEAALLLPAINPAVTALWPPTGFALALVLLRGYRICPSILVVSL